jgi:phosphoglycolate phosphatase
MDAYLFDLDGTLIDSFEDIAASANHALRAIGLPTRPSAEIFPFIGEGAQRLVERTIGAAHASLLPQAMAAWREHYAAHLLDRTRPYDGIAQALASMTGPKAVVTNKPGASARRLISELGLAPLLPIVLGADDVPARKPDPAGVRLALSQMPPCDRAVLIGDSAVDAQTARSAGTGFVAVLWGLGKREELAGAGARIFASHPRELPQACAVALQESRLPA